MYKDKKVNQYVGKKIKELRESQGLSISKLARITGVSQPYISMIEKGDNNITLTLLKNICQGMGYTLQDFFKDEKAKIDVNVLKDSDPNYVRVCHLIRLLSDGEVKSILSVVEKIVDGKVGYNNTIITELLSIIENNKK